MNVKTFEVLVKMDDVTTLKEASYALVIKVLLFHWTNRDVKVCIKGFKTVYRNIFTSLELFSIKRCATSTA